MELYLVRDLFTLRPATAEDADKLHKMHFGRTYRCVVTMPRNYQFHKKFFALINVAWELLPERVQAMFKTCEAFRQQLLILAGHSMVTYDLKTNAFREEAKSISFAELDEGGFTLVYDSCVTAVFEVFRLFDVTIDEKTFMDELLNFIK